MKQFKKGDIVRRTAGSLFDATGKIIVRKGWLYKVTGTHGLQAIKLQGVDQTLDFDVSGFQLEPSLRPGIAKGTWVRRTGTSRNEVVSGGVYQVAEVNDFSLSLVGVNGTYGFGKFEPVPEVA